MRLYLAHGSRNRRHLPSATAIATQALIAPSMNFVTSTTGFTLTPFGPISMTATGRPPAPPPPPPAPPPPPDDESPDVLTFPDGSMPKPRPNPKPPPAPTSDAVTIM